MNWLAKTVLPKIKALVNQDSVKENLWVKCSSCAQMIFHREFEEQFNTCTTCGNHMPLPPHRRMALLFDGGQAEIITLDANKDDPLQFRDLKKYTDRLRDTRGKTGVHDAIMVAAGTIGGINTVVAAFDFRFMGGSMGRAVGDGILKAADEALKRNAALITVPSTGGARMQEGILSLMQLPRTIIAVNRMKKAGLPYMVLLAHPTTGGVTASFAMLGDIQMAEPGAIIGFAGRRVIEETVREKLPEDFQTAEYLQEHGMVDMVTPRSEQPKVIGRILGMLMETSSSKAAE
ncbi:MAG: acetyl-CoA carboxylase carboxyltransferase subunit beta [Alphaproteobacteria bacterium]|nr:acetyl-CoA carboxylase carboxyltransferase subunit beta [Alphaproteobacteria bacterium]